MADWARPSSAVAFGARQDAIVSCWLCGIHKHSRQMVPDGGSACADIRWYCQDARACTDRWTLAPPTGPGGRGLGPWD